MTSYVKINGSVVFDFAKRTLANLRFIEAHKQQPDVYEVTQMINSLLGLLVFPKEEFWNEINPIALADIAQAATIHITCDTYKDKCSDLAVLIRHMRNSVSHFNIEFRTSKNYITRVEMHDELKDRNHDVVAEWSAEMTVSALRDFVVWFIEGVIDSSLLKAPIESIA